MGSCDIQALMECTQPLRSELVCSIREGGTVLVKLPCCTCLQQLTAETRWDVLYRNVVMTAFHVLSLLLISTNETDQDPMVHPPMSSAYLLSVENFSQRVSLIREMRT